MWTFRRFNPIYILRRLTAAHAALAPTSVPHSNLNTRRHPLRRPNGRSGPEREAEDHRINHFIQTPRVLLIDEEGQKLGVFLTRDALELAHDRGLDLVEVAPDAQPPVCRIIDYGRLKYDNQKRKAEARRSRTVTLLKEVKVRPKTDDHDMDVKIKHARRFLSDGNKVKVTVRFRGREHAHHDIGADQCLRLAQGCDDLCKIEVQPQMDGRQMTMILSPS